MTEVELVDSEGNTISRDDLELPDLSESDNSEEDHDGTVDSAETENEEHSEEDDEQ